VLESLPSTMNCTGASRPESSRSAKRTGITRAPSASPPVDRLFHPAMVHHVTDDGEIARTPSRLTSSRWRQSGSGPTPRSHAVHVEREGVAEQDQKQHRNGDPHAQASRSRSTWRNSLRAIAHVRRRFIVPPPAARATAGRAPRSATRTRLPARGRFGSIRSAATAALGQQAADLFGRRSAVAGHHVQSRPNKAASDTAGKLSMSAIRASGTRATPLRARVGRRASARPSTGRGLPMATSRPR